MVKKVSINSLRKLQQYKNFIKPKELEKDLIVSLTKYGERIIQMAYKSSTFKDRTGNLHDSYVSAVFVNGNLQSGTIRWAWPQMSGTAREYSDSINASGDPEQRTGREEAMKLLSKFGFTKGRSGGVTLVIAAAMFYAGILEDGVGAMRRKYLVLSQVQPEMETLAQLGIPLDGAKANIPSHYVQSPRTYREGGMGRMQVNL